jgi:hypothetical protein
MGEPPDRDRPGCRAALRGVSALALSLAVVTTAVGAPAGVSARSQATVVCTTKAVSAARVLPPTGEPFVVRTRLIEDGYARYRFSRNGHPWGCPVAFDDGAAVSVAKQILSGRNAQVRLTLDNGRLVHLGPRETPLRQPAQAAKARADLQHFLTLLAHGNSIAACATVARDTLRVHGGRDGCVMAFESAKFLYRERYARASVQHVALFNLDGDSYALATINRTHGYARALLIRERGTYRYRGDLDLSPIELW